MAVIRFYEGGPGDAEPKRIWPLADGEAAAYYPNPADDCCHVCRKAGQHVPAVAVALKVKMFESEAERIRYGAPGPGALRRAAGRYLPTALLCQRHADEYRKALRNRRARWLREVMRSEYSDGNACAQCGDRFMPKRSDSRYCSDACRVKAYRQRKKAQA